MVGPRPARLQSRQKVRTSLIWIRRTQASIVHNDVRDVMREQSKGNNLMALRRRELIWTSGALLAGGRAEAQGGYPSREVRIVVPFATGGTPQFLARLVGQGLSRALGQPFVVQNRAGDGGMVGTCVAGVSAPDGHTLLLTTNSVQALALNAQPCIFDVATGLTPISLLAFTPAMLCVPGDSRLSAVADLVAAAQAAPGALRYGTPVRLHLPALAMAQAFDINVTPVVATGPGALIDMLIRGRVDFAFLGLGAALAQLRAGHLRALAVTTAARLPQWPEVPTLAELGMPGFQMTTNFGLLAPSRTPEPILARLSEATMAVMRRDITQELLAPLGIEPVGSSRAEAAAHMGGQARRLAEMMREYGIEATP
jgi:tripartite-type tricarboxylate transporter receptor subunit TctC